MSRRFEDFFDRPQQVSSDPRDGARGIARQIKGRSKFVAGKGHGIYHADNLGFWHLNTDGKLPDFVRLFMRHAAVGAKPTELKHMETELPLEILSLVGQDSPAVLNPNVRYAAAPDGGIDLHAGAEDFTDEIITGDALRRLNITADAMFRDPFDPDAWRGDHGPWGWCKSLWDTLGHYPEDELLLLVRSFGQMLLGVPHERFYVVAGPHRRRQEHRHPRLHAQHRRLRDHLQHERRPPRRRPEWLVEGARLLRPVPHRRARRP